MCHPNEGGILKGDFLRTNLLSRSNARSLIRRNDIIIKVEVYIRQAQ